MTWSGARPPPRLGGATFHADEPDGGGTPVFEAELHPDDGLYLLPYMARQADGSAWDDATTTPGAPESLARQTFFPDASRIYAEIERFGVTNAGTPQLLGDDVDFDFFRPAPSGGYKQGLPAEQRTDVGAGPIEPEVFAEDFHAYFPFHLNNEPHLTTLAKATNLVADTLASGAYAGAQWLEGSPTTEESMYWLSLVIDTTVPIVGHCAQRPHQTTSADGARNICDGVKYILSGIALWQAGDRRFPLAAGEATHHPPNLPHAMHAGPDGFLAMWRWSGDIGFDSYRMLPDPEA